MAATAAASGTEWEARPLARPGRATPGERWGIEHRPTGAWIAFGSEARCRALVAQLTEADAILSRPAIAAAAAGGVARPGARR